jgi:penicillin-binding protein 2
MTERRTTGVLSNAQLPFKLRDHALFISFAPSDNPRYALGMVLEHNGHIVHNLDAPATARDVFTYIFDRERGVKALETAEKTWGGDIRTRMAAQEIAYRAAHSDLIPAGTEFDAGAATSSAAVEKAAAQAAATAETVANTHAAGASPAETGSPEGGAGGGDR